MSLAWTQTTAPTCCPLAVTRVEQLAGAAALADPFGSGLGLPVGIGDVDVAAKADHVAEAQLGQEGEQLLVAEATIGQDGDPASGRHEFRQATQAGVLEVVALLGEFVLPDADPQQRRRAAMAGDQAQHQRGLVVMVEVGPVHRHQSFPPCADLVRNPTGKALPNVDSGVAEQAVHLLDRMLGHQAPGLRQRLADQRHRQRRRPHHPERRARQRGNPLRVQIAAVDAPDEGAHFRQPRWPPIHLAHRLVPTRNPLEQLPGTAESRL
jgi:hypothetical protein